MQNSKYVSQITFNMVKDKLPKRAKDANKGDFGKLLCVCGSKNMPGAADLCIGSALRSGVGIVRAAVIEDVKNSVSSKISECTYCVCPKTSDGFISCGSEDLILNEAQKCDAVAVGCGMGRNSNTKKIVYSLIKNCECPVIIDADGINVISENINILSSSKSDIILTPHLKEFERLCGVDIGVLKTDKQKYAQKFANEHGVIVVCKGYNTVVAGKYDGTFLNPTGNVGMAKGGSGDVLTGIIGSLVAQGIKPIDAAICGVYIHGKSGDLCREKYSTAAMLPSDIISELSQIFLNLEKECE